MEKDNVPLSCTLINNGRHVVCGTTSSKAVVLDAITLAHQADLFHCESGLVQDIAYCNAGGANILATTASEKGAETTIKIWTADVVPGQSIGFADRVTEAFRSVLDLLSDLYGRLVHWHSYKIEISILSFLFWVLVFATASAALFYLNASDLGIFGPSVPSACNSFRVAAKRAFVKGGPTFLRTLKFSIHTCYLFLKGVTIALYEFLEEQPGHPSPNAGSLGLTFTDPVTVRLDGTEFGGALGNQDFGIAQGNIPKTEDPPGEQSSLSLDGTVLSVPVEYAIDQATTVEFQLVEVDAPAEDGVPGRLSNHEVTTDVAVHTNWLP